MHAAQVLLNTMYVTLWISLSGTVILYNKWILAYYGFPYPITLTMWHMLFSSALAFICVRSGYVAPVSNMTAETYMRAVVPIGALFAGVPVCRATGVSSMFCSCSTGSVRDSASTCQAHGNLQMYVLPSAAGCFLTIATFVTQKLPLELSSGCTESLESIGVFVWESCPV